MTPMSFIINLISNLPAIGIQFNISILFFRSISNLCPHVNQSVSWLFGCLVSRLVCRLVGPSAIISLKDRKLHCHALFRALVFFYYNQVQFRRALCFKSMCQCYNNINNTTTRYFLVNNKILASEEANICSSFQSPM